jgi:hypothetical protein
MRTRDIALTSFFFTLVLSLQEVAMPALHFPGADVEVEIPDAIALLAVALLGWRAGAFLGIADGLGNLPLAFAVIPKSMLTFAISGYLASRMTKATWAVFLIYLPLDSAIAAVFFNLAYGVPFLVSVVANALVAIPGGLLGLLFWTTTGRALRQLVRGNRPHSPEPPIF